MNRLRFFAVPFAALSLLGIGHADTIKTFGLSAQLAYTGYYPDTGTNALDGTLTVDIDTGAVLAVDFDFVGRLPVTFRDDGYSVEYYSGETVIGTSFGGYNGQVNITPYGITIAIPVVNLVGYAGGQICSTTRPCAGGNSSFDQPLGREDYVTQGVLGTAPEPSSLLLITTGLLGVLASPATKRRFGF